MKLLTKERKTEILSRIYREPNDELHKKIQAVNEKVVLLQGEHETGKTTTLLNIENRTLNKDKVSIYTKIEIPKNLEINELLLTHYFELIITEYMLNYIKSNYFVLYERYFKDIENIINGLNSDIPKYFRIGELTGIIIKKLKSLLNINEITLLIDDLNEQEIFYQIISRYFSVFDKVIISTKKQNQRLHTVNVDYGMSKDIIAKIYELKIQEYNKKFIIQDKQFPYDEINSKLYDYIIEKSNGNIGIMIRVLLSVYYNWTWDDIDFNLIDEFHLYLNEQVSLTYRKS